MLRKILKKIPPSKRFAITGGEPLLRDDIEEIIKVGKEYCEGISFMTNGTLIDDDIARMFKKYNLVVQVPFHGMEKTHNKLVGRKDGYKKAIMGVAYLKKHDVNFAITSVGNKRNIHELEKVFELGVALGAKSLRVIRFMPGGQGMQEKELMLNGNEYMQMLEALNRVCKKYKVFGASGAPNVPCKYDLSHLKDIQVGDCSAGIDWLVIDPSGRVRPCNHSPSIVGDLRTQSFEEIWNHQILKDFRAMKLIPDECDGCKQRLECRGGCRAVAETMYGSLKVPEPLMVEP